MIILSDYQILTFFSVIFRLLAKVGWGRRPNGGRVVGVSKLCTITRKTINSLTDCSSYFFICMQLWIQSSTKMAHHDEEQQFGYCLHQRLKKQSKQFMKPCKLFFLCLLLFWERFKTPFCIFSCVNPGFGGPWDMSNPKF